MRLAISQSNYIPWIGYFKLIANSDVFIIYDSVQYTKNDWRNRNLIYLDNIPHYLTIPVKYSFREKLAVDQVRLPESDWRVKHLSRIRIAYEGSKYFTSFFPQIEKIINSKTIFLSDLNYKLIYFICSELNISTRLVRNEKFDYKLDKSQRIIDKCKELSVSTYLTTPKAINYLNFEKFRKENIEVEIIDFNSCLQKYDQKSTIFNPFVSILDLLFLEGPINSKNRLF